MTLSVSTANYQQLIDNIGDILAKGRSQVAHAINQQLVNTYWLMGYYIVEFEQAGQDRANYGDNLMDNLAKDLTERYGKGFSRSNLFQIRSFYLRFPKIQTASGKLQIPQFELSWSHYVELLKEDNDLAFSFYLTQSKQENWSVRELKRQMKSMLFHRLALSKDKQSVMTLSQQGQQIKQPADVIKDPYVLEFLNIEPSHQWLESDLENSLIDNLQQFLLELGKGFAFVKRQYRISLGGKHYYVDLVFYHRILKCFVLIDLKRGEVTHQDIGQMNLYLNYFRREENVASDNEPIGLVLGAYKDQILVEYATDNITNQLFVSKYQLYLPNQAELEQQLQQFLVD